MRTSFVALITLTIGAISAIATENCSKTQFWYENKSCCLDNGGPEPHNTPAPPKGRQCPSDWYWHSGKTCCVPRAPSHPAEPTCPEKCTWNKGDSSCHEGGTTTTNPGPQPTHRYARKAKRSTGPALCPAGLQACEIVAGGVAKRSTGKMTDYECTNPMEDLNACGGCVSSGKGRDCTAISNAWNVGCAVGVCQVYTCAPGYKVSLDGRSCRAL